MTAHDAEFRDGIRRLPDRIVEAQRPLRVREAVKWDDEIEAKALASGLAELPDVGPDYYATVRPLPYDAAAKISEFGDLAREAHALLGRDHPLAALLARNCREYQDVVRMLLARGTPEFYRISRDLYGSPKDRFAGDTATLRDLGLLLHDILAGIPEGGLGANWPRDLSAEQVVEQLNDRFGRYFGDQTVHARLDDVPVLAPLVAEGLIAPPRYLPPHFRDLNGLALWMAYSNFLNRVNLASVQEHWRERL